MAQILLFLPKVLKEGRLLNPRPALGLLFVASGLVKSGYRVTIIDEEVDRDWKKNIFKKLANSTVLCAGVSAMTGSQIEGGLRFSEIIKKKFDVPVIWGGLHASILPEQTVRHPLVDIAVCGEGEEALLNIAAALISGDDIAHIKNIWWKRNGKVYSSPKGHFIDLDKIPSLPYELMDCGRYIRIERPYLPDCKRTFELHTDRGCPHRCGFCYNIAVNKSKWRGMSALNIIGQIEYLVKMFRLDGINFVADNFFYQKQRVIDICNLIIRKRIKIIWHADCRIDYFMRYDAAFIKLLKRSGCRTLTLGVESGSQKILDMINKDINIGDVFRVNKKLSRWGLGANYHFMVGFPGETKKDVMSTYRMMIRLRQEYPKAGFYGPSLYTPYPGTPLFPSCIKMGFNPPDRLEDWARFDFSNDTFLSMLQPDYSRWLMKSADNIIRILIR